MMFTYQLLVMHLQYIHKKIYNLLCVFTETFASHITGNPIPKEENSCDVTSSDASIGDSKERSCDSLIMCIVTTLNQGLRNGGGIGDILRAPSSKVSILFY